MHYCGYIITRKTPTENEIQDILEPYNEATHDNLKFSWDWFEIGGRYGGKLKIKFNPDENEDKWFCNSNHDRNFKYFISNKLKKLKEELIFYDELECMIYMGLRENILYVDGAYYKDIYNFDITNTCFVIDCDKKLYSRELWINNKLVEDEKFDEKVKNIDLNDKFITVIDIHD